MPLRQPRRAGLLLKTDQTTCYHAGDNGDLEPGLSKRYSILTGGQFAGTTNIDVPHYAGNQISFTAPNTIADAAAGLVTILTGDTIRVRGSILNDGVYTVAAGGVAGSFTVVQAVVNEIAGAYINLSKRSAPSNNCVQDNVTGLVWKRYATARVGSPELIGEASTGLLKFYNVANAYSVRGSDANLQMIANPPTIHIVNGAAEAPRFYVGMPILPVGFANPVNNLPGYIITAITVAGAHLDLSLRVFNNTLISEAAGGARTIRIVCRSIFAYCAAANLAAFAGYTDWRAPDIFELVTLANLEAATAAPDAAAFPSWPTAVYFHSSNTNPAPTTDTSAILFGGVLTIIGQSKGNSYSCALVRG